MINQYYQQELSHLRDLAVEFSKAHPALAPMLSGATQDPDVERLLEGTAFLTGLLRQKLDDEFPEVVHGLMSLIFPHYLRPIPATTVVAFSPKPSLNEMLKVPAGVVLDSVPVEGTKCSFRTCYEVEVHPLVLSGARLERPPGRAPSLILSFNLTGLSLSAWRTDRLRLHVTGAYGEAAGLFHLLVNHTQRLVFAPRAGGRPLTLDPDRIKPVGLANQESLLPYPTNSFPGYRVLQEYLILPEKFLFLDVTGLEAWQDRGDGSAFDLTFELSDLPAVAPQVRPENFTLFATPAINVFDHDADPILLDHRQPEYGIAPSGGKPEHYQVYSVESVVGFLPGTVQKREFIPFQFFAPMAENIPAYYINRKSSPIGSGSRVYISVAYPPQTGALKPETLSIKLKCTNGELPSSLQAGDISRQTSSSPELCEFRNIQRPSAPVQPPIGKDTLWRLLSHLSLNLLSLGDKDNIKALLRLYIFPGSRDRSANLANEKRIDGIMDLRIRTVNRLFAGVNLRGQAIDLKLNPDNFAGPGDMYLFGAIMDYFLGTYASINCFTQLRVEDSLKGEAHQWPVRTGDRPLI
jgi:type VI secretion system protein ImpG